MDAKREVEGSVIGGWNFSLRDKELGDEKRETIIKHFVWNLAHSIQSINDCYS